MTSSSRPRTPSWMPTLRDIGEAVLTLLTTTVGLAVAVALIDGVRSDTPWAIVLAAAVVVAVGDLLLRAPLRFLARRGSAALALGLGLLAQVAVLWLALSVVPGIGADNLWSVLGVLVLTAIVMAVGRWVIGSSNSDYVVSDLVRRARRQARREGVRAPSAGEPRPAGMLVVQLDGVAAPVLREAIEAGLAPNVQRWMSTGTHTLEDWWARIPSTTPASQAGLLHGDSSQIPAFRWWDRDLGRLVVTNHPEDAALVEQRLTTGKGLLAGGGTAVSTMFSGDAATSFVVMSRSRTKGPDGGLGPGPAYVRFFASPFVLARAVSVSVGEMFKELYQAHRQRIRDVQPRISRGGWYVVLRGITNVLLRDLNTSLVAEALLRGVSHDLRRPRGLRRDRAPRRARRAPSRCGRSRAWTACSARSNASSPSRRGTTRSSWSPTTARRSAPPTSSSGARRCSTRCARSWPSRPPTASRATRARTGGCSTPWSTAR